MRALQCTLRIPALLIQQLPAAIPADMAAALEPLLQGASSSADERRLLLGPGLTNLGACAFSQMLL